MKKDGCFFIKPKTLDGGGNFVADPIITIRRRAAIGDVIAATCVADKLVERGYKVGWQADPGIHCVLRRHTGISSITVPEHGRPDVDLDGAYENDPHRATRSFAHYFITRSNEQLRQNGIDLGKPTNCTPHLFVGQSVRDQSYQRFLQYPKPWIFIVPRSHSWMSRTVMDDTWQAAAEGITGTKFWMGIHPAPSNFVDLGCRHLDNLINWISVADLVVTVDTGPLHIAAALGIPCVAIGQSSSPDLHLSDQNDFITVWPDGLDCLNCQQNVCPKDPHHPPCQNIKPEKISAMANARINGMAGKVSACISIYKPDRAVLQRCLDAVLPQVDEVVICWDKAGTFPDGILVNEKIRRVKKSESDIGYGRKQNYASRHAHGEWLLHLNDDCFLEPYAVQKMLAIAKKDTGILTPLLRFPDRTIYHAGKFRSKGVRGWGHIDWRQMQPTHKSPVELENTCGCCVLVRRKAFFEAGCYDEDIYLCSEDDALSLAIRREGYKIIFVPQAEGTHLEHHSASKTQNFMGIVHESNQIFNKKWGKYLDHNLQRVPMGNFDY